MQILLTAALLLAGVSQMSAQQKPSGAGTADSPYLIGTADELLWFRNQVNGNGKYKICAKLTADIIYNEEVLKGDTLNVDKKAYLTDENEDHMWIPINNYQGTFDGAGHFISGLYYEVEDDYVNGFFRIVKNATIKNLTIKGSFFRGSFVGGICGKAISSKILGCEVDNVLVGGDHVGAICGRLEQESLLNQCRSQGTISGNFNIGGIVGSAEYYNEIDSCVAGATIKIAKKNAGGICGYSLTGNKISCCLNHGDVTNTGHATGGICGNVESNNTIVTCINYGTIKGGSLAVGGIAGNAVSGSTFENMINRGVVIGDEYVGGICGYAESNNTFVTCTNKSEVSGFQYVGGICGNTKTDNIIMNSYNTGDVDAKSGLSGGICGSSQKDIILSSCYNTGNVTGYIHSGAIAGFVEATAVFNCYYIEGSSSTGVGGVGSVGSPYQPETVTREELENGTVAKLLNTNAGQNIFHQSIGSDTIPSLDPTHGIIYLYKNCKGVLVYTNDSLMNGKENVHIWGELEVITPAKCPKTGKARHYCTVDNSHVEEVEISGGHKLTKHEAHLATCDKDGNYEYWTCAIDPGNVFKTEDGLLYSNPEDTLMEALGHDYVAILYENMTPKYDLKISNCRNDYNGTHSIVDTVWFDVVPAQLRRQNGQVEQTEWRITRPFNPTSNAFLFVAEGDEVDGYNVVSKGTEGHHCKHVRLFENSMLVETVDSHYDCDLQMEADSFSFDRNVSSPMASIVMPVELSPSNINGTVMEFDRFDGSTLYFKPLRETDVMKANHPYMVVVEEKGAPLVKSANDVILDYKAVEPVISDRATFFGTYAKDVFWSGEDAVYYGHGDGAFRQCNTMTLYTFRAAIKYSPRKGMAAPRNLGLSIGENLTGVVDMEENGSVVTSSVNVYDALGRMVRANVDGATCFEGLPTGVYVVNGKKFVIKSNH